MLALQLKPQASSISSFPGKPALARKTMAVGYKATVNSPTFGAKAEAGAACTLQHPQLLPPLGFQELPKTCF